MSVRHLLVWSGTSALVGATLYAYKGVAILATGDQPEHAFEIAPFFLGLATITLLYALIDKLQRPRWLLLILGWLAVSAGAVAAISHFAGKEDDFGDLGYLVNFLSTIILLFLISGDIRQKQLLPRWSFTPRLLAWVMALLIPVGAVLEGINERLLEVPLLAFAGVWMMVGLAVLSPRREA
jgi:uncharacterized membrane protein HdeD (DUF308 family)